ncbi:hypothetical protein XA68_10029 [Ophiocordyceps unilateralis]|uniref:Uncharacterized protein n=1 Tax=Ophiocordyceps unilateralis TaxID=268505 RepID=A0A2A9PQQ5_OPHUN|nr:hypothetical protein XA68_10029 [Ophiocordyceps unilateralis]
MGGKSSRVGLREASDSSRAARAGERAAAGLTSWAGVREGEYSTICCLALAHPTYTLLDLVPGLRTLLPPDPTTAISGLIARLSVSVRFFLNKLAP